MARGPLCNSRLFDIGFVEQVQDRLPPGGSGNSSLFRSTQQRLLSPNAEDGPASDNGLPREGTRQCMAN